MRMLGFNKKWDKLQNEKFTTFRFSRKDRDWEIGEQVQVVFKPRSKEREILGKAYIETIEMKLIQAVTEEEAIEDGFDEWIDMLHWMEIQYGFARLWHEPMNKLTLRWIKKI